MAPMTAMARQRAMARSRSIPFSCGELCCAATLHVSCPHRGGRGGLEPARLARCGRDARPRVRDDGRTCVRRAGRPPLFPASRGRARPRDERDDRLIARERRARAPRAVRAQLDARANAERAHARVFGWDRERRAQHVRRAEDGIVFEHDAARIVERRVLGAVNHGAVPPRHAPDQGVIVGIAKVEAHLGAPALEQRGRQVARARARASASCFRRGAATARCCCPALRCR